MSDSRELLAKLDQLHNHLFTISEDFRCQVLQYEAAFELMRRHHNNQLTSLMRELNMVRRELRSVDSVLPEQG